MGGIVFDLRNINAHLTSIAGLFRSTASIDDAVPVEGGTVNAVRSKVQEKQNAPVDLVGAFFDMGRQKLNPTILYQVQRFPDSVPLFGSPKIVSGIA